MEPPANPNPRAFFFRCATTMALDKRIPLFAVVLALTASLSSAQSIPMDFCANINTASSDPSKLIRDHVAMSR